MLLRHQCRGRGRRAPKDAHGERRALLAGRDVDATADDTPETRQNLGWAELVAQFTRNMARGESSGICCNHLSERSNGTSARHWSRRCSATTSPGRVTQAPQLKNVVTLVEQPGRPDLRCASLRQRRRSGAQPGRPRGATVARPGQPRATFAREDVSVQTLVRMTDDDLAALEACRKGRRVQILAWASR